MIHIMITRVCPHQNNALEGVLACAYVGSLLRHAPLATPTSCDASISSFPPTPPPPSCVPFYKVRTVAGPTMLFIHARRQPSPPPFAILLIS